jgi:hypothetical protein
MRVIEASGLKYESHSMGTNIECGWEDITPLVRKCHEALRAKGVELIDAAPRVGLFGHEIAFLQPDSAHGVLTELVAHG